MALPTQEVDYYELLRVSRNAPVEVIRASYRTLMQKLKHHPDLGGDVATAALINEAYAVLCDAERRAEYDAYVDALALAEKGIDLAASSSAPTASAPKARSPQGQCAFCGTQHAHGVAIAEDTTCVGCNSPLFPVENHRLELSDQRAVARINKSQQITFYTMYMNIT